MLDEDEMKRRWGVGIGCHHEEQGTELAIKGKAGVISDLGELPGALLLHDVLGSLLQVHLQCKSVRV